jgi:hypothetical protein
MPGRLPLAETGRVGMLRVDRHGHGRSGAGAKPSRRATCGRAESPGRSARRNCHRRNGRRALQHRRGGMDYVASASRMLESAISACRVCRPRRIVGCVRRCVLALRISSPKRSESRQKSGLPGPSGWRLSRSGRRHRGAERRRRYARAAAQLAVGRASWRPLRELISSLVKTFRRCHSTVRALM